MTETVNLHCFGFFSTLLCRICPCSTGFEHNWLVYAKKSQLNLCPDYNWACYALVH